MRCGVLTSISATLTGVRDPVGDALGATPPPNNDLLTSWNATRAGHWKLTAKELTMNWDTMKGQWKQFRGKVKEQWGKLTDDDLDRIEGKRDQLVGAVQKRYGVAKEEAEKQLRDFETSCSCDD
jgi:uncharacterized protein YjbJ (UPF0337 family)